MKTSPVRAAIMVALMAAGVTALGLNPVVGAAQELRTIATGSEIPLAADAPDEYIVKPGDTLWDISRVFLRDSWYWPEVWHVNPQVANPHRIYPGDVLRLTSRDGRPQVSVAQRGEGAGADASGSVRLTPQVRSEPLDRAIYSIPYEIVASFMGRPTLLDKSQIKSAPYLVGMRNTHIIAGEGYDIYARGIGRATLDSRYSVVHVEEPIRDPDNNDVLGYSARFVGAGPVVIAGDPAKLTLTESQKEALQGDKLFPEAVNVPLDFVPHAPSAGVDAAIIAVQNLTMVGQYQVVALNRGKSSGLEPGHVLTIYQTGDTVRDLSSSGGLSAGGKRPMWRFGKKVKLPDERTGELLIFSSYNNMSFALVMEAVNEIRQGDRARTPT